jgi:hypothetical protein
MDSEIDLDYPLYTRILIGLILALWACDIGPEVPGIPLVEPFSETGTPTPLQSGSGKKLPQKNLGDKSAADIDRDAFLVSYKRQARASLDACLQSWIPSPGRATFVAVLSKSTGRLSNLEVLGGNRDAPGCVVTLSEEMNFSSIADSMVGDNVTIQWNAVW